MFEKKAHKTEFLKDKVDLYRKGIAKQREIFKDAHMVHNYDVMVTCLENIKAEIKTKAMSGGNHKKILLVERIIKWYKELPYKHTKNTPNGRMVQFPPGTQIKVERILITGYETLVDLLVVLGLL